MRKGPGPGECDHCGGIFNPIEPHQSECTASVSKTRPDWHAYFMAFAVTAAARGTCDRKRVGAVLVLNQQILATGYNGSIRALPHCDDVGHDMKDGHCVRTIHAEMNALAQAAKHGVSIDGSTIYTTASPCWNCFRILVNAGIRRYVYKEDYRAAEHGARIKEVTDAIYKAGAPTVLVEKLEWIIGLA